MKMNDGHRRCRLGYATALFMAGLAASSGAVLGAQEIRIKVLDGRTGRPVTNACIAITVTSQRPTEDLEAPADNKEGVAVLHLSAGKLTAEWPATTRCDRLFPAEAVLPQGYDRIAPGAGLDCRPIRNHHANSPPWYSISEILRHGVVGENYCGSARAEARPGELILFTKPVGRAWWVLHPFR